MQVVLQQAIDIPMADFASPPEHTKGALCATLLPRCVLQLGEAADV